MNLTDAILNCQKYEDTEETINCVFAKKIGDQYAPHSEAVVLQLTPEEMGMKLSDISIAKCPGYEYFLEIDILKNLYEDLSLSNEYKSDEQKVNRIIHYAEFDA